MTWNAERYFAKAQRYWLSATRLPRDSENFLLQVSFFCEFLIRGCLVLTSPTLNAAPNEDSILFAAGLAPVRPPKSVDILVALNRVQRLVPALTEQDVMKIAALLEARNGELHSDIDELAGGKVTDFLPSVYVLAVRLSEYSKQDLDVLLGVEDAAQARNTTEAKTKDRKRRVNDLIRIQKDRFFGLPKEAQADLRSKGQPGFVSAVMRTGHHVRTAKCPSCASEGLLAGTPIGRSGPILRDDGIFQEVRVQPDVFECKCCSLAIKGLDELMAADFPHEFTSLDDKDPMEYFGIDPMDYIDTEEIVREYQADMQEYQDE